ncbi:MAG: hypothetical protein KKC20_22510 [Proteobacteria bacterium]|nr:hypothetical protein [Pseudomonadota bacterium]
MTNFKAYKVYFDYGKFQKMATEYRGAHKYSDQRITELHNLLIADTGTGTNLTPGVDENPLKNEPEIEMPCSKTVIAIGLVLMAPMYHCQDG